MNVKDIIDIEITGSGMNGEGVARCDGKVVFVPYTLKGERVRAVVKSVKKNYATASVIKVLDPSPHRVKPVCPHYFKCGGCDMGHVDADYRREALTAELVCNLKKIAGLDVVPSGFTESDGASRNKISMPFGTDRGAVVLGMYRQGTHDVEPVSCYLADDTERVIVKSVLDHANANGLSVYDERTGKGLLRHLVMRRVNGGRVSVVLVTNGEPRREVVSGLVALMPACADFFISVNIKKNNVIMGDGARLVKGNERLSIETAGVKAELSPLSFFQVNDGMRDMLYAAVCDRIVSPTLIDLYSGIGITSNLAAKKCDKVIAMECVPQAVKDADETAELNGNADKITNMCGDAEKLLPAIKVGGEKDVLVDPPRKGCDGAVIKAVAALTPKRFIYVSCNHATMCRDIRLFLDESAALGNAYDVNDCRIFDMFPQTHHIETLFCLERK